MTVLQEFRKIMMICKLIGSLFFAITTWNVEYTWRNDWNSVNPATIDVIESIPHQKLILFDGLCNVCNKFVDSIRYLDNRTEFKFCPLQDQIGSSWMSKIGRDPDDFSTIVYIRTCFHDSFHVNTEVYTKSDAVLKIAEDLGVPKSIIVVVTVCFPSILRNIIYDWIAKNRFYWFGKRDQCRCIE